MNGNAIISQRIKDVRNALGLTQQKLADDLKISQSHAGAMELGTRKIPERIVKMISYTYNVSENWLKTGTGNMFNSGCDYKLEEMINNFKKLDGLLQDYVLKQIRLALEYQEARDRENN